MICRATCIVNKPPIQPRNCQNQQPGIAIDTVSDQEMVDLVWGGKQTGDWKFEPALGILPLCISLRARARHPSESLCGVPHVADGRFFFSTNSKKYFLLSLFLIFIVYIYSLALFALFLPARNQSGSANKLGGFRKHIKRGSR